MTSIDSKLNFNDISAISIGGNDIDCVFYENNQIWIKYSEIPVSEEETADELERSNAGKFSNTVSDIDPVDEDELNEFT